MKATATPAATIPAFSYVCNRCGRIASWSKKVRPTTCHDCRTIEADLADPARIARLDRRLDPPVRTHCAKGHDVTGANGFRDNRGWLGCIECRRASDRRRTERRRAS